MDGPLLQPEHTLDALHRLIRPFDRIVLEGDNQKQAEFLSRDSEAEARGRALLLDG